MTSGTYVTPSTAYLATWLQQAFSGYVLEEGRVTVRSGAVT